MKSEKEHSPNWGGRRPGAGRKPPACPVKKILLYLPVGTLEEIDDQAEKTGESRNAILRRAIHAFLGKGDA